MIRAVRPRHSAKRVPVFRNVTAGRTGGQFSKIIDWTELPKIARQFHTSPFSLCCRDGGQREKEREREREGDRERRGRDPGRHFGQITGGPLRSGGRVMAAAPKTNYSDKPNYLPSSLPPSLLPSAPPFPACPIKSGQVVTKFSISRSRKPGRCRLTRAGP